VDASPTDIELLAAATGCSREKAERILAGAADGDFLLRASRNAHAVCAISLRWEHSILSVRVFRDGQRGLYVEAPEGARRHFRSLRGLLAFYAGAAHGLTAPRGGEEKEATFFRLRRLLDPDCWAHDVSASGDCGGGRSTTSKASSDLGRRGAAKPREERYITAPR
jgi:SH2 domain